MAGNDNLNAHKSTYSGFLDIAKWGVVAVAIIAALVVWLLV